MFIVMRLYHYKQQYPDENIQGGEGEPCAYIFWEVFSYKGPQNYFESTNYFVDRNGVIGF